MLQHNEIASLGKVTVSYSDFGTIIIDWTFFRFLNALRILSLNNNNITELPQYALGNMENLQIL